MSGARARRAGANPLRAATRAPTPRQIAVRQEAVRRLAALDEAAQVRFLRGLSLPERRMLTEMWDGWAHDGQVAPPGDWAVWMMVAGRGYGKTRAGAEWISERARTDGTLRIALVGGSVGEVRRVMIEGESGLLAVQRTGQAADWAPSLGRLTFASGAEAYAYSGAHPEALRGPQHGIAWCDEMAKWGRAEASWRNLRLGLRLGARPQVLVTTTPRPIALLRALMDDPRTRVTGGGTRDNPHLPPAYVDDMVAEYGGTRIGRQELDGEMIADVEDSLWPRERIEACRAREIPPLERVVIGVDPPAKSGPGSDACGIVAAGVGADGRGYVLEDASVRRARPEAWAAAVAACYHRWNGSRVVAEGNQGGEMVDAVLRAVDAALPITVVHATRGKCARAEPVAALYAHGRVSHAGAFPALEDEMAGMTTAGRYEGPGGSPDRADALVWALGELMLGRAGSPGIRRL